MKRTIFAGIALLLSMACTQDLEEPSVGTHTTEGFKVGFESIDATRVQLDGNRSMFWNEGDLLSVFDRTYDNLEYKFTGKTGDTHGTIIQNSAASGIQNIVSDKRVAIYPYNTNYKVLYQDGYVETFVSPVQTYRAGSFGADGNVMIGVSEDKTFQLRSTCGWLCVKLTGNGELIRRITVQSNRIQLSGHMFISMDDATMKADPNSDSINTEINYDEVYGELITNRYAYVILDCGENGVELGKSAKTFYIALPPNEYDTLYVTAESVKGENIILRTNDPITIKRNTITPMETLDNSEAQIKTCEYYLEALHDSLLRTINYWEHTDFGYPSIGIYNDFACKQIVANGWTLGQNYHFNRFYLSDSGYGYGPTGAMSFHYWYNYYPRINICNRIIALAAGNENVKAQEGIARTYRAMLYIDLARLYECLYAESPNNAAYEEEYFNVAGLTVPIVDENTTEESARNNPRATREELFNFIFNDLKFAEEALTSYTPTHITMPDLAVVYGLYARAYMWLGGLDDGLNGDLPSGDIAYNNAAYYARKAINTHGGAVMTENEWTNPMIGFNTVASSWMWALDQRADTIGNNLIQFTAHMSPEALYGYTPFTNPGISSEAYNHLSNTDFRKLVIKGPDKSWYEFAPYTLLESANEYSSYADYTNFKFRPANGERTDYINAAIVPIPLMRCEEMYFIEMEAEYHAKGDSAGRTKLNEFMKTYRDPEYSFAGYDVLKEIIFHKGIEFWGEGIIMYDMKRLDMGVNTHKSTNYYEQVSIQSDGRLPWWTICFPQDVVDANVALQGKNNPDPSTNM